MYSRVEAEAADAPPRNSTTSCTGLGVSSSRIVPMGGGLCLGKSSRRVIVRVTVMLEAADMSESTDMLSSSEPTEPKLREEIEGIITFAMVREGGRGARW